MTRTLVAVMAIVIASVEAPRAQPGRGFDVASVKRIQAAPGMPPVVVVQAGRLRAPSSTVRDLIQAAYSVEPNQIIGGPGWMDSDRFEIAATLPAGAATTNAPAMLQKLLADRFGLVVHRQKRNLPVLILERAGKLGSDVSIAGSACREPKPPAGLPVPPPPPPPPPNAGPVTVLNQPPGSRCASIVFNGFFSMRSVPFGSFVTDLSRQSRRIIIDRTNLTGFYDVDLYFVPDAGPLMVNGNAINADAPSMQTAIREQLGLRIESARAPVDVVVIDRVSTPTEN